MVYDQVALSKGTAQRWFCHFSSGRFAIKDRPITEKSEIVIEMDTSKGLNSHH